MNLAVMERAKWERRGHKGEERSRRRAHAINHGSHGERSRHLDGRRLFYLSHSGLGVLRDLRVPIKQPNLKPARTKPGLC